jgi:ribonuclease HII
MSGGLGEDDMGGRRQATGRRRWLVLRRFDQKRGVATLCGVDEAGRGPLAGPVVAGAVILRPDARLPGVDDSKRLTPAERLEAVARVREGALGHAVVAIDSLVIDRVNIRQATFLAMRQAVSNLTLVPELVLIDGFPVPELLIRQEPVFGGDRRSLAIAAASILAKVHRDALMDEYHRLFPEYGFDHHRGYCTADHLDALRRHGPCPIHRRSFAPTRLSQQLAVL